MSARRGTIYRSHFVLQLLILSRFIPQDLAGARRRRQMNKSEAMQKLAQYGQEHILKYYDELDSAGQEQLLRQIEETDFSVLRFLGEKEGKPRGTFTPLAAMELDEITERREEFRQKGLSAIREGKVAALMLAGGMGTRLGSENPKGMYDIGITRHVYIFQRLIENLLDVVHESGYPVHLLIMTSEKNHDATVNFLKEKQYFGYPEDRVHFFRQSMAPACGYDGKILLEGKGRIATSPNGNAGWYASMDRVGLVDFLEKEGVKWINVFAVDNVLQRIADPVYVGACETADVSVGGKVVRKAARDEKVGVICLEDGRPSIVEYYDLSDEMMDAKDAKGNPAYNFGVILNYLFQLPLLKNLTEDDLPMHVVEKKIPCLDEAGEEVHPSSPNGYKFEQLVLDMIHQLDTCLPFEVVREHEFAPIKNPTGIDSVESARELCKKNGIEL